MLTRHAILLLLTTLCSAAGAKKPLEAYTETLPGTEITFEMVPVPAGLVAVPVGAEDGEPAYVSVELPAYWIGKCEVTWAEYRQYMALDKAYAELQQLTTMREQEQAAATLRAMPQLAGAIGADRTADAGKIEVDAVTAPTPLYDPSTTYESGEDPQLPAVTMTPFAARQYTKWLSALTGRHYRLPSEAEWVHAALGGSKLDAAAPVDNLDAQAWHTDNSDYTAQPVGQKAANGFGMHDALGNAAEWVLDGHRTGGRPELAGKVVDWNQGVAWPRDGDPPFAKGGWYDGEREHANLRSRMVADEEDWKSSDPNLPMSPWWYADYPATGVGFRVVRTAEPLPAELQRLVWDTADTQEIKAVTERMREGRGKLGPIGKELPRVLEELGKPEVRTLLE